MQEEAAGGKEVGSRAGGGYQQQPAAGRVGAEEEEGPPASSVAASGVSGAGYEQLRGRWRLISHGGVFVGDGRWGVARSDDVCSQGVSVRLDVSAEPAGRIGGNSPGDTFRRASETSRYMGDGEESVDGFPLGA